MEALQRTGTNGGGTRERLRLKCDGNNARVFHGVPARCVRLDERDKRGRVSIADRPSRGWGLKEEQAQQQLAWLWLAAHLFANDLPL